VSVSRERLDVIVVPSARRVSNVVHAAGLANVLGCPLIVLASHDADASELSRRLAGIDCERYLVDFDEKSSRGRFPQFRTSALLADAGMLRDSDVSGKRNLGLAVAQMCGLRNLLFLDDDMQVTRIDDLYVAAGLLRQHDVVGLRLAGFPDNSVVCHANRETGGAQDTFIGAGAMAVAADRVASFFPNVYNDDWLFLLDGSLLRPVTATGCAIQAMYDPFADQERARIEEFGDVLAEGVFAVLDNGYSIRNIDDSYWRRYLRHRRRFIQGIIRRAAGRPGSSLRTNRMVESLRAAVDQLVTRISPELCMTFLEAWRLDCAGWGVFRNYLDVGTTIPEALSYFGAHVVMPPAPVRS
jgi:hypothetical protein